MLHFQPDKKFKLEVASENEPALQADLVPALPADLVPVLPSDLVPVLPADLVSVLPADLVPVLPADLVPEDTNLNETVFLLLLILGTACFFLLLVFFCFSMFRLCLDDVYMMFR